MIKVVYLRVTLVFILPKLIDIKIDT